MTTLQSWQYNFENQKIDRVIFSIKESNLDSLAITLPEGVYTTLRIYQYNKFFQLDAHFQRLEESLRLSKYEFNINKDAFGLILKQIVDQFKFEDIRLRIHIPFNNLRICFVLLEEILPNSALIYSTGVKVKTNQLLRTNPQAKLTSFIQKAYKEKGIIKKLGLEESIITNKKSEFLEGLTSNFFAIQNDVLRTADKNVLHGVTRKLVIEEAEKNGIKVLLKPITINDLSIISEAFITSTSRGVMPVIQIDDNKIGTGFPGKITLILSEFLNIRINEEIRTI